MATMQSAGSSLEEQPEDEFQPLTAEQAQAWRERHPPLSVWRVIAAQLLVGAVLAAVAGAFTGRMVVAVSTLYGALAVAVPAALFARGVTSQVASVNPTAAAVGFLVWEGVKLALTVALLMMAPRLVRDVSWPALLVGLVVTMKVYWVALAWRRVFHLKVQIKQS